MKISLHQVLPVPLIEIFQNAREVDTKSQIWNTGVHFNKGQKYLVNAPSGKGKSTFIHLLYGLRQDYQGEIYLDRQNIRKIGANVWSSIRQSRMSIVFQDLRLFHNLTAEENILVKAYLQKKDVGAEIREMAQILGVQHLLPKKAGLLSYGERQRVAIIRALVQPFDFILLDEPFSHLDEENIAKACELFSEKCRINDAGMIMTSLGYDYPISFDQKLTL
jgi:ABC-type lipoprotein export system ATPase subunit